MSEKPSKQTREKPLPHAEAYKKFKDEMEAVSPRIEESYKTAQRAVREYQRNARRNKEFLNPKTLSALRAEMARLKKLQERVNWQLSATTPFSSAGAPPFRIQRDSPRKRGKSVAEHVDTLVLGEKKAGKGRQAKSLEDPVTTRAMTPTELESFITSIKTESVFKDPRTANGEDMVIERPTRRKPNDNIEAFSIYPEASEKGGGNDDTAELVEGSFEQDTVAQRENESSHTEQKETEKQISVKEAEDLLLEAAARFTLESGHNPFPEGTAYDELDKALLAYLDAVHTHQNDRYHFALSKAREVRDELYEKRMIRLVARKEQKIMQVGRSEEAVIREIVGEEERILQNIRQSSMAAYDKKEKRKNWFRAGIASLILALGFGAAKALEEQPEGSPAKSSSISNLDVPRGTSLSELLDPDRTNENDDVSGGQGEEGITGVSYRP